MSGGFRTNWARAALVGAASGLRSQAGLAAVALTARPGDPGSGLLARRWGRGGALLGAVGEAVADKLPATPSRLAPAGLLPRLVLGGLTGGLLAARDTGRGVAGGPPVRGALVGVATAAGAAVAGARWRRAAWEWGWPDWPAALVEDAVTAALAYAAVRGRNDPEAEAREAYGPGAYDESVEAAGTYRATGYAEGRPGAAPDGS
ncbi:hypothetical protein NX801_19345 [Streptomyces sp. LP05-1]|uniref:DUF4126 domain-containing protein n=1 Tax=Streptomyces pyxinae TaxID=2970734 RepID=A0ABT2CK39_9ACTN|nr:hypothetical protein [Streptomyces sp. LP05-1]MCS0637781.1 hypothetical protein [Streptomyces sp. LP05-1]